MNNAQPVAARAILLEHANRTQAEPHIYRLLAEAQSAAGFIDEVHESQGQFLFSTGDLQGAKAQFELALGRSSDDPYAMTRIRARIDQIKQILEARKHRH